MGLKTGDLGLEGIGIETKKVCLIHCECNNF